MNPYFGGLGYKKKKKAAARGARKVARRMGVLN